MFSLPQKVKLRFSDQVLLIVWYKSNMIKNPQCSTCWNHYIWWNGLQFVTWVQVNFSLITWINYDTMPSTRIKHILSVILHLVSSRFVYCLHQKDYWYLRTFFMLVTLSCYTTGHNQCLFFFFFLFIMFTVTHLCSKVTKQYYVLDWSFKRKSSEILLKLISDQLQL